MAESNKEEAVVKTDEIAKRLSVAQLKESFESKNTSSSRPISIGRDGNRQQQQQHLSAKQTGAGITEHFTKELEGVLKSQPTKNNCYIRSATNKLSDNDDVNRQTECLSTKPQETSKMNQNSIKVKGSKCSDISEVRQRAEHVVEQHVNQIKASYIKEKLEFSIMICGSPRVGKSTLVNTMCGRQVAPTSDSLDACTTEVKCYSYADDRETETGVKHFKMNIWDTPGIEEWEKIQNTFDKNFSTTNPICLIFCTAPGAFTKLDPLNILLEKCKERKIFVALVVTNMFSNNRRNTALQELKNLLTPYGDVTEKVEGTEKYPVTYYGEFGLCTMVNCEDYVDDRLKVNEKPQGVNELIFGIMQSLSDEKLLGWCNAVLENRTYWDTMKHAVNTFFSRKYPEFSKYLQEKKKDSAFDIAFFLLGCLKKRVFN